VFEGRYRIELIVREWLISILNIPERGIAGKLDSGAPGHAHRSHRGPARRIEKAPNKKQKLRVMGIPHDAHNSRPQLSAQALPKI
jgi:hypothetical protein